MPRNTSISLGAHWVDFVDEQVVSGRYRSVSDVVRAGLRLLEGNDRQDAWLRTQNELDREADKRISR